MIVAQGSINVIKYQFHSYLENLTHDDIQKVKSCSRKYKIAQKNQLIEGDNDLIDKNKIDAGRVRVYKKMK